MPGRKDTWYFVKQHKRTITRKEGHPKKPQKNHRLDGVYDIDRMRTVILNRIASEDTEDYVAMDDEDYREIFLETVSNSHSGTYQPGEIADYLGMHLPKSAKTYDDEPATSWNDYEWAWEDIEKEAERHAEYLNKRLNLPGEVYFGHAESDGDYGLWYRWHKEHSHGNWARSTKVLRY